MRYIYEGHSEWRAARNPQDKCPPGKGMNYALYSVELYSENGSNCTIGRYNMTSHWELLRSARSASWLNGIGDLAPEECLISPRGGFGTIASR